MQYVTLVDKNNVECGICEKIKAHREKKLHRAFSVFIFNDKASCLFKKEPRINITPKIFGQIPVAVIRNMVKI